MDQIEQEIAKAKEHKHIWKKSKKLTAPIPWYDGDWYMCTLCNEETYMSMSKQVYDNMVKNGEIIEEEKP